MSPKKSWDIKARKALTYKQNLWLNIILLYSCIFTDSVSIHSQLRVFHSLDKESCCPDYLLMVSPLLIRLIELFEHIYKWNEIDSKFTPIVTSTPPVFLFINNEGLLNPDLAFSFTEKLQKFEKKTQRNQTFVFESYFATFNLFQHNPLNASVALI